MFHFAAFAYRFSLLIRFPILRVEWKHSWFLFFNVCFNYILQNVYYASRNRLFEKSCWLSSFASKERIKYLKKPLVESLKYEKKTLNVWNEQKHNTSKYKRVEITQSVLIYYKECVLRWTEICCTAWCG